MFLVFVRALHDFHGLFLKCRGTNTVWGTVGVFVMRLNWLLFLSRNFAPSIWSRSKILLNIGRKKNSSIFWAWLWVTTWFGWRSWRVMICRRAAFVRLIVWVIISRRKCWWSWKTFSTRLDMLLIPFLLKVSSWHANILSRVSHLSVVRLKSSASKWTCCLHSHKSFV